MSGNCSIYEAEIRNFEHLYKENIINSPNFRCFFVFAFLADLTCEQIPPQGGNKYG